MTLGRLPPAPIHARADATLELRTPGQVSSADTSACLSADELLELLLGAVPEDRRDAAFQHIADCEECRILFRSAAQAMEDTGPASGPGPLGAFQPGMLVARRYRVERFLACGGMGEVYCVLDQVLHERVALKTVRSRAIANPKAILRLKSELLLSRRIGHPNTCRIFEFGEHAAEGGGKICFLTMELVEGETLGERLRREGPIPIEQVPLLVRQLLGGLAEAHSLGIVHRDLKSDNIMLRTPPSAGLAIDAVIMDFGLALRVDSEQRLTSDSHALVGSAAYMAPEQIEGERLTPSTDVYAFGIILFELLTGQLPFRASTPASTALQRLHSPPPPPSSVRPGLEPRWDRLVLGCLERVVERRFASARDVLAAFEQAASEVPSPVPRRSRRRILGVAALLSSAALVSNAALWSGAASLQRQRPATESHERPLTPQPASSPRAIEAIPEGPVAPLAPVVLVPELAPPKREAALPGATPPTAAPAAARANSPSARRVAKPSSREKIVPAAPASAAASAPAVADSEDAPPTAVAPAVTRGTVTIEPPSSPLLPLPLDPEFPE